MASYSTNDALSIDTKVDDLVTLTVTFGLENVLLDLLPPWAKCFIHTSYSCITLIHLGRGNYIPAMCATSCQECPSWINGDISVPGP